MIEGQTKFSGPNGGFSLLEVMLAVTIFTIVTAAIHMTFRTGMRAYDIGMRSGKLMQTGRFATDTLARDLKNVFYQVESSYNFAYNKRKQEIQNKYSQYLDGQFDDKDYQEEIDKFNSETIGIDLAFNGESSEETSSISFVRYQPYAGARPLKPFNLARVEYYISDGCLVRTEEDIIKMGIDFEGEEQEPEPARPETIVRGVKSFELLFGYYYDGRWMETRHWDSSKQDFRTDQLDIARSNKIEEVNQIARHFQNYKQRQPGDNMPSYVRMRLAVSDPTKETRIRTFERTVNIAVAFESHVPMGDELTLKDDDGEEYSIETIDYLELPDATPRETLEGLEGENERIGVMDRLFGAW